MAGRRLIGVLTNEKAQRRQPCADGVTLSALPGFFVRRIML